jgi:nitric oxide reductase large subunit
MQEGGLVGTHPHYKWIFEPVYARKRAGAHVSELLLLPLVLLLPLLLLPCAYC